VRGAALRLMASKPNTIPMSGPRNAMNCAREKSAPVEVNRSRKTSEGWHPLQLLPEPASRHVGRDQADHQGSRSTARWTRLPEMVLSSFR